MDFETRARNLEYKFTELEDQIVAFIIDNKTEVSNMKIVDLAQQFFTVPNTITRFCHKLGYEGFTELKIGLKHEISGKAKISDQLAIIERNIGLIDSNRELKISKLFKRAKSINFYAKDQTHLIAELGVECFQILDKKFQLLDYEKEVISRINTNDEEVFFFISVSGETQTLLELAKSAKEHGHKVISLTNLSNNSLSKLSDISIYFMTELTYINGIEITDKSPIFIILQSLFQKYLNLCNFTLEKTKN